MLGRALTEVVQKRAPLTRLGEIIGGAFGEQDVTGVTAIHDALRNIDSGPGNVGAIVHILHLVHGSAVNAHAQFDLRVTLQRTADFNGAADGCFGRIKEDESHPIPRWNPDQFAGLFGGSNLLRATDRVVELLLNFPLFVEEQFGITDHVHEQDMTYLQLRVRARVRRHWYAIY
jgi:hypothetical protein